MILPSLSTLLLLTVDLMVRFEDLVVDWLHSLMLAANIASTSEDNRNWKQATNGPFADEY